MTSDITGASDDLIEEYLDHLMVSLSGSPRLRLGLGQPGRQALGHRVAQVRLDLGHGVPDLPRAAAERDQNVVEVLLDQVVVGPGDVAGHAGPPAMASGRSSLATEAPRTRAIDVLKSRHWLASAARAASPAKVSR